MTDRPQAADAERAARELAQRNEELEALDAIGRLAARVSDLQDFLDETGRIVEVLTRCANLAVYRFDEALGSITLVHQRGIPPEVLRQVSSAPVVPPAIFTRQQPAADVVSPAIYPKQFQAPFEALGIRALARVPLVVGARVVGELVVAFTAEEPHEAEAHLRFLRPLGALMGAVVTSNRLLGNLRRRVSELTLLNDVAVASAQLDPVYLLEGAIRRIAEVLGATMGAAFLKQDDGLHNVAIFGIQPEAMAAACLVPIGRGPCGAAVQRQTVVTYTDPEEAGGPFAENMRGEGLKGIAGVPLMTKSGAVGAFMVGRRTEQPFSAEEQRFLETLATQLGVAVENSRLYADLKHAQAQLIQRERLAALGALSAAVAHEVRNPLGVIFNAVGMLRRHRSVDEEGRELVDIVAHEAERLNRIVTDLLGFARPAPAVLRPAALGPIVEEAVRAALAGQRVPADVAWELASDLPTVAVDAGLVRQALINLVLNALQAMPRGGRLHVRTHAADGFAAVEVTDTGHGIPAELRERIFEPFFTTRTSGTGLGLAIVKHVVEVHGGAVEVSAGPEGGTRFALRFPLSGGTAPGPAPTR